MNRIRTWASVSALAVTLGLPQVSAAQDVSFDKSFLTDYSRLAQRQSGDGTDFAFIAPRAVSGEAKYNAVMVDQPVILMSPDSPYKSAKPENLLAIANGMRASMSDHLKAGHYNVVEQPGPGVLYLRMALTDVQLVKKKRGLLAYTPVGAVVKLGVDALKDFSQEFDILKMVFQSEITDSATNEVFAQYVGVRGGGDKPIRMDFDKIKLNMDEYGARLRCRLDNVQGPADKQIDCMDSIARRAREDATPK